MANSSAKDYGSSATKDYGSSAVEHLKETAGQVGEKIKDATAGLGSKAREAASTVGDMVSSAASSVGKSADKATSATGSSVKHLGETIKEKGPQDGVFGTASRAVADTLEKGGKYLEQEGLSGMMDDVTELIRRNPMPAILVGIGLGFLIGRTLRS